jgi:hypothetical protein
MAGAPRKLFNEWVEYQLDCGVSLHIGEVAIGEIPFELNKEDPKLKHVNIVQLRGDAANEIWIRDAIFNRVVKHIPETAKYLCWDDTDLRHTRDDWAVETLHMLQRHRVGQTWSHSIDLGHKHSIVPNDWGHETDRSFCWAWMTGDVEPQCERNMGSSGAPPDACGVPLRMQAGALLKPEKQKDWRAHTGYSWSIRRETLNELGGLLDWMVTGSSDWHMAYMFAGYLGGPDSRMSPGYQRKLKEYARRCDLYVKQDIGCVEGALLHGWHGRKVDRQYMTRFDTLLESGFDPDVDLIYDNNGLPRLTGDNRLLRDGLRRMAANMRQDLIDV